MNARKPARLKPGGRIGIVAPAGCVSPDSLQPGLDRLCADGYVVEIGASVYDQKGYLAGDPVRRAADLTGFFQRPDIDAIFCARGGFGSIQLLPHLSRDLENHPKVFVGYSDITVLLNWLSQSCHMVTFHAPMVADEFAHGLSEKAKTHLWGILSGALANWSVSLGEVIRPGRTEAELMGGCLSLLVTTLGTPYEIDSSAKILFIEDVGERPYRIERMLTHLKMAGKLDRLAGVVIGDFTACVGEGPRDIRQICAEVFHDSNYPVVMGMPAGHGQENLALPFGVKMCLDGDSASLAMLESPVS